MFSSFMGRLTVLIAATALIIPVFGASSPVFAQANTLKLGAPSLPPSRGNPLQGLGTPTSYVWSAIFDAMTRLDENGEVSPEAAVRWKNMSPTTWQIELRPNVKFHNGEPLDAAGVAQNILYLLNDDVGRASLTGKDLSQKIAKVRAIDELTLEIETTFPNPEVAREVMKLYLVAPKAWQDLGLEGFSANPSGTGSYKVEDWGGEVVKLVADEGSWRKPNIERFQILNLGEAAARLQALLSGQIDVAVGLSIDSISQLDDAGYHADIYSAPYIMAWPFISVESTNPDSPFTDKRVRQAANYAVDKDNIVQNLLNGNGFAAGQGATRQTFGYNPDVVAYPYDPDKARALLAEAGLPNGFEMAVELLPGNFPADSDIYQQVAQDLGKVGIDVEVRAITFADFLGKCCTGKAVGFPKDVYAFQLDFPLGVGATAASLVQRNWSCRSSKGFYCNEAEMALLVDAETEFDVDKRRAKLQKLMASFHDNAPGLFITEIVDLVARSPKVEGLVMVNRILNYHQATKAN
jgi:peptide/nickel transport system substrate-binding protein